MSEEEMAKMARKRAEAKAGFWVHLGFYVVVNVFLAAQWWIITGGSGFPWFLLACWAGASGSSRTSSACSPAEATWSERHRRNRSGFANNVASRGI